MSDSIVLREGNLRVKRCRHGWMAYNAYDLPIGLSLDRYGEYSELELHLYNMFALPDSIVWDIGANIGTHTVFLSKRVGPRGSVFALEPQRHLHQNLQANLTLNQIENVRALPVAMGPERKTRAISPWFSEVAFSSGALKVTDDNGEPVEQHTPETLGLPPPAFIKIDVEGGEPGVLAGATPAIEAGRPVIYLDAHDRETAKPLINQLTRLRYQLFWHPVALFNEQNFFGASENIFGQSIQWHFLALPSEKSFQIPQLPPVDPAVPWLPDEIERQQVQAHNPTAAGDGRA